MAIAAKYLSLVYLADGREIRAEVQRHYGSGTVFIDGRSVTVERLATPYEGLGWGEVVRIHLQASKIPLGAVLQPQEYRHGVARVPYIDPNVITAIYDKASGQWREMTDAEYEKERRAWDADERDMQRITDEWRAYRNEGLGKRG